MEDSGLKTKVSKISHKKNKSAKVPPTEERETTVKRKERTAECPVDSQGVSARREFTE